MKTGVRWKSAHVTLVAAALLAGMVTTDRLMAQGGPDNTPTGAQGFVDNIFSVSEFDSINEFNGALTLPIKLGPEYPIGPKLKFQAILTYNSKPWEYGGANENALQLYSLWQVLSGDPALGPGWTFTAGKIIKCGKNIGYNCYVRPDGAEVMFLQSSQDAQYRYFVTGDTSQYRLRQPVNGGSFTMWDGDGNEYIFDWLVTGYDAQHPQYASVRDYNRGRDGYHLRQLKDPFGNKLIVTYWTDRNPCITACSGPSAVNCNGSFNSWIPRYFDVQPLNQAPDRVAEVSLDQIGEFISGFSFKVKSPSTFAQWDLRTGDIRYGARGPACTQIDTLRTIVGLDLPSDITGTDGGRASWQFTYWDYAALMKSAQLPTSALVQYWYGNYHYYGYRPGDYPESHCGPLGLDDAAPPTETIQRSGIISSFAAEPAAPELPEGDPCLPFQGTRRYQHRVYGVLRRTVSAAGITPSTTDYVQYSAPAGRFTVDNAPGHPAQSLTVVLLPPDVDTRRRARATLYAAAESAPDVEPLPGGDTGRAFWTAYFDSDPNPGTYDPPGTDPVPTGRLCADTGYLLCAKNSTRLVQNFYGLNGSVTRTKTYYGKVTNDDPAAPDLCDTCIEHEVTYTANMSCGQSGNQSCWEDNGRHYNVETHRDAGGTLLRTISTDWAATTTPWQRNLYRRQAEKDGTISDPADERSVRNTIVRIPRFNATGFLRQDTVYDAPTQRFMSKCYHPDAQGNPLYAISGTAVTTGEPDTACLGNPAHLPAQWLQAWEPSNVLGRNGDLFGKTLTYARGLSTTAAWLDDPGTITALPWFASKVDRDPSTGWVTFSYDTAGSVAAPVRTEYRYDSLGRVVSIDPPGAEVATTITYQSPLLTIANRPGVGESRYHYDGLGRLVREIRPMPAGLAFRTHSYDPAGHKSFESEWTACTSAAGDCATAGGFGTSWSDFDPFGREGKILRADGSTTLISWTDSTATPAVAHSVTRRVVTVKNVNGECKETCPPPPPNPPPPCFWSCTGGSDAVTTSSFDLFGKLIKLREPGQNFDVLYSYDVAGKLVQVGYTNSTQKREFRYDALGFKIWEKTPEKGEVDYSTTVGLHPKKFTDYGSLGNLRGLKEGGVWGQPTPVPVSQRMTYEAAGRLVSHESGNGAAPSAWNVFLFQSYDSSVDCSAVANCGRGKLTARSALNFAPLQSTWITESFLHDGLGGRMSRHVTQVGNGGLAAATTLKWTYNNLGLPEDREIVDGLITTTSYTAGYPTQISSGGSTIVSAVQYNPAGRVKLWKAGPGGNVFTATITPDPRLPERPGSISAGSFSTNAYVYDGAGNIKKIGTDTYSYDTRLRLTGVTLAGQGSRSFALDQFGNLDPPGFVSGDPTKPVGVSTATNRLTGSGFVYDARGNLTGIPIYQDPGPPIQNYPAKSLSYDLINRQYRETAPGIDWVYLYDGADERLVKYPGNRPDTRRDMARYIAEAKGWTLPACDEQNHSPFNDVPCSDSDARHIKALYLNGVTGGCQANPPLFCPDQQITRGQMAVFLTVAYHTVAIPNPPAQATFTDVPLGHPLRKWIEELVKDGVTSGCGGNNFCPNAFVTGWEISVFLAAARHPSSAAPVWAAYRPVPRGAHFTFRDEANRILLEAQPSAVSGSSSATVTYGRTNVYFGNMLVASNVTSPLFGSVGWSYYATDHLGSIRFTSGPGGTEEKEYWPYGEIVGGGPTPLQKLQFAGMERDTEGTRYYDHARHKEYLFGRFLSPDKVQGRPEDPQSWNRYAYARNNPLVLVDPDGNAIETFVDIGFILADVADITSTIIAGEQVTTAQWLSLAGNTAGALVPFFTGGGLLAKGLLHSDDAVDTAIRLPKSLGADAAIRVTSSVGKSSYATRLASGLGDAVQKDVDHLVGQLVAGNANPGIGTRALGGGFFELRGRAGGRVIVKQTDAGSFDIVGKFQGHAKGDKANSATIQKLIDDYQSLTR
jgi:RHS repeat-associated protein